MRALLVVLLLSLVPTAALVDEPASDVQAPIVVHGHAPAPSVVPVLGRARVRYRAPELAPERRPTAAIIESASRPPL